MAAPKLIKYRGKVYRQAAPYGYQPMPSIPAALQKKFEAIAKLRLGIDTLREQKSDRLDFHDVGVLSVTHALYDAYQLGWLAHQSQAAKDK
jgi:hypothetical protein